MFRMYVGSSKREREHTVVGCSCVEFFLFSMKTKTMARGIDPWINNDEDDGTMTREGEKDHERDGTPALLLSDRRPDDFSGNDVATRPSRCVRLCSYLGIAR